MTPSWDFTSRPSELELDDVIQIKVFEADIIGKSDFCGGASAQLSDLLGAGEQELPLFLGCRGSRLAARGEREHKSYY